MTTRRRNVLRLSPWLSLLPFSFCLFSACAPPGPRPYYSRARGEWKAPADRDYAAATPAILEARLPVSGSESKLRKVAESYLGTPYRFGGQSKSGIDCSGFVRQVFQEALGIPLPHNAAAMSNRGSEVSKSDLKAGDLIFFRGFLFIDHVGIYMGGDYFIHSQSGIGVTYTRLDAPYFGAHFAGAKRV